MNGWVAQTNLIGYDDGLNLYDYLGSNPVSFSNPRGSQSAEIKTKVSSVESIDPDIIIAARVLLHLVATTGAVRRNIFISVLWLSVRPNNRQPCFALSAARARRTSRYPYVIPSPLAR